MHKYGFVSSGYSFLLIAVLCIVAALLLAINGKDVTSAVIGIYGNLNLAYLQRISTKLERQID